jgi:hypothetical protein
MLRPGTDKMFQTGDQEAAAGVDQEDAIYKAP